MTRRCKDWPPALDLEAAEFHVLEADSGDDCLQQVHAVRPELIVLDVMMPGIDGFEVCRRLRSNPDLANIPVLMVTGLGDEASIERAFEVGATDFLGEADQVVATGLSREVHAEAEPHRAEHESRAASGGGGKPREIELSRQYEP